MLQKERLEKASYYEVPESCKIDKEHTDKKCENGRYEDDAQWSVVLAIKRFH